MTRHKAGIGSRRGIRGKREADSHRGGGRPLLIRLSHPAAVVANGGACRAPRHISTAERERNWLKLHAIAIPGVAANMKSDSRGHLNVPAGHVGGTDINGGWLAIDGQDRSREDLHGNVHVCRCRGLQRLDREDRRDDEQND